MTRILTRLALASLLAAALALPAAAQSLPAHKDQLFAYPPTISTEAGGAYRVVAYDEVRDINGRDEVPERRAHARYVSLGVRRNQADLTVQTPAGSVRHVAVGRREGARLIVVYLHGQGGSRSQGVNDYSFGGNFNRIKNLVAQAGGVYLSPDFSDFGAKGAAEIAGLINAYAAASPRAPVFIACGSMGGALCWRLARDPSVAPRLGGLLLLGSMWDDQFTSSEAFKRRVPVFIGQGSRDKVFPVDRMESFFRGLRSRGYPVKMVRFETGSHGTPIRMTDWRETINWMLSAR
ncbi:alpha/beta hydrolase family protein [Acuticoccus kandeliae]|uniref:alpha/beta hydrolase family protein n=1 Tax=Acuticoccus kandeliae TaxID=2073160 RepID=UPI00196A7089|nr:alpha/beta hydrolase [Acuticoccus kandeliae]